ncbi:sensor histidine kinase [Paenibacillus yanchengensis]|uniref:histidine kinase n=1 Tax=Paenibacillus yanchengensis TaxID=2035833 RepID=A0ABW4YF66_9BACL
MKSISLPIHWKFTIGFILLFSLATGCLYYYMSHVMEKQTKLTIQEDMKKLQLYTYDFIQQYTLIHQGKEAANERITPLLQALNRSTGHSAAYFDKDGHLSGKTLQSTNVSLRLDSKSASIFMHHLEEDQALSLQNKSIVTIVQDGRKHLVLLTLPYYVEDQYEGMFRMVSDYSSHYTHNDAILKSLAWFLAVLFIIVPLFSYLLSIKITRPLLMLSRVIRRFGEGKQENGTLPLNQKDEVGQLAQNFQRMKEQIEKQMEHLTEERNKVIELEQNKRRLYQHITHELKTPLTSISGYAQIIGEPGFHDAIFLERAATRIKVESDRLHTMVVQVLELARQEEGENRQTVLLFDLGAQLKACCEDMEIKASRYNMKLQCDVQDIFINGQEEELRRVWVNLLDNAIRYGAARTAIAIKMECTEKHIIVQVRNKQEQDHKANVALIFEPFYRENNSLAKEQGSIGLGLAICRSIVEHHAGTIQFRQDDRSVIVQVQLPLGHKLATN